MLTIVKRRFGARGTGVVGRGQSGEVATGFERLMADASADRDLVEAGVPLRVSIAMVVVVCWQRGLLRRLRLPDV